MLKKITIIISSLALILSMLCAVPVGATAEPALSLQTAEAAGIKSLLTVEVKLAGNPGLSGASLHLDFDPAVFTLQNVEKGALCGEDVFLTWHPEKSDIALATAGSVRGDGVLVRLTLRVADTVNAGDYTLKVSAKEFRNDSLVSLPVSEGTATVSVRDYLWGDVNGDKQTGLADAQAILQWKVGLLKDEQVDKVAGDADRSGTEADPDLGIPDALMLLQWLNGTVNWDANGQTPPPTLG